MLRFVPMAEQLQQGVAPPTAATESVEVRRFPHLVDGAKASTGEDQRALAGEINQLLLSMRAPGYEAEEARAVLKELEAHRLDGLVDKEGRSCRKEAVETLLVCGFPHALEVAPADLQFARAWDPRVDDPQTEFAARLKRNRRNGAAVVVGSEAAAGLLWALMGNGGGATAALAFVSATLGACVAAIWFASAEPKLEGQGRWATALVMCALVQLATAFALGPAALVGGVGVILGLWAALTGQAQALDDPMQQARTWKDD